MPQVHSEFPAANSADTAARPHTFWALDRLTNSPHVQVALMGHYGLAWPWESLHVEAAYRQIETAGDLGGVTLDNGVLSASETADKLQAFTTSGASLLQR